jgi:rSAM/selenodomain-associated transferase 1
LQAFAQRLGWTLVEQPAGDLGERMRRIATLGLAESDAVILMGNDCPALDGDYLRAAGGALQEQPVVIGPAEDGGYVLLGLRRIDAALFSDMPWGTERVFDMTLQRLQQLDWRPALLPALWDVDRPEDLSRLAALNILI